MQYVSFTWLTLLHEPLFYNTHYIYVYLTCSYEFLAIIPLLAPHA